jgi:prolyl oligopeptidase
MIVTVVNQNALVVVYMHDAKEELSIMDLSKPDDSGSIVASRVKIELPAIGTIAGLSGRKQDTEMFYHFFSFTYPGTIFRYDFTTQSSQVFREIRIAGFDPARFRAEQVFYKSKDGTDIPMFIIHPDDFECDASRMVYLYGYGGFSISLTPSFNAFRCVLMNGTGCAVAIANLRGGYVTTTATANVTALDTTAAPTSSSQW